MVSEYFIFSDVPAPDCAAMQVAEPFQVDSVIEDNVGNFSLENLAIVSNSEMVYGVDSQGNQVPLAVILGDKFECVPQYSEVKMEEGSDIANYYQQENGNWVGAVEECTTDQVIDENPKDMNSSNAIKVYKVNKASKKKKPTMKKSSNEAAKTSFKRTLQQLKKTRKKNSIHCKPQLLTPKRRKSKLVDPTFPIPASIRYVAFKSKD